MIQWEHMNKHTGWRWRVAQSTPSPSEVNPRRNHIKTEACKATCLMENTSNLSWISKKNVSSAIRCSPKSIFPLRNLGPCRGAVVWRNGSISTAIDANLHTPRPFVYKPEFSRSPSFVLLPLPMHSQFSINSVKTFTSKNLTPALNTYSDLDSETGKEQPKGENVNWNEDRMEDGNSLPHVGRVNGQQPPPILESMLYNSHSSIRRPDDVLIV
jgi:hypothetical protein